jgi:hypothetical protein
MYWTQVPGQMSIFAFYEVPSVFIGPIDVAEPTTKTRGMPAPNATPVLCSGVASLGFSWRQRKITSPIRTMYMRVLLAAALVGSAVAGPEWAGIKAAEGDAKHKVVTSKKWGDAEFEYNTLARSGQKFGSNTFGMITDKKGGEIEVSHNPDFASILTKYDGKLYMVTQFESPRPGVAYFSELEQDADGKLKMVSASPMDFSSMGGLWIPCAGSVSPWGSHIGSEEYEPDARAFFSSENPTENGNIKDFMRYFPDASGSSPDDLVASGFNPYFYGYAWETKVADGKPITEKWYTQGRMSWELPYGESVWPPAVVRRPASSSFPLAFSVCCDGAVPLARSVC